MSVQRKQARKSLPGHFEILTYLKDHPVCFKKTLQSNSYDIHKLSYSMSKVFKDHKVKEINMSKVQIFCIR